LETSTTNVSHYIAWIVIGFISGAVPWAVIVGKIFLTIDVRNMGDGNPGAVNAWKSGGYLPGVLSVVLEICKSLVPVYFAKQYLDGFVSGWGQIGFAIVAFAPILGHAWSPFLRFKGGKALATTWGSWIGITGGIAFPVGILVLGLMHVVQKNHAITVTVCLSGFLIVFMPFVRETGVLLFWLFNMGVVIYKHRYEYSAGVEFRGWISRMIGTNV
tara:strand:+ start:18619 stop:19263 length:645 start_codon:yes stop_codon:yes gene_type:complete